MEQLSLEPEKAADDAFKKNSMKPAG
jgi:hypothetical protein